MTSACEDGVGVVLGGVEEEIWKLTWTFNSVNTLTSSVIKSELSFDLC